MHIGAGLPPVPPKLVQKIQAGEYVDMAELLPDRLGVNAGPPVQGDKDDKKPKHRQVTNILEWIQMLHHLHGRAGRETSRKIPRYAWLPNTYRGGSNGI